MPITTPLTREDDRRDEQESHQVHSERLRGRAEAGREQIMHDRLGKDGGDDGGESEHDDDEIDDGARQPPRARSIVSGEIVRKGRNEGRDEDAARDERVDDVGDAERCDVSVVTARGAKLRADDDIAQQAQQAAGEERHHHDEAGARDLTITGTGRGHGRGLYL